jgi:serine/threonine protein kinase
MTNVARPATREVPLAREYVVERELGTGGMGLVTLRRSRITDNRFAVKQARFQDARNRHRFLDELVTWFDLPEHPHLATCRFFRTIDEEVLIFAEFVDGGSLADWIRDRRLSGLEQMLDVAIQSAVGLHAVHASGLTHHDIKSGNMLLTESGVLKLTDFGLAKALAAAGQPVVGSAQGLVNSGGGMTLAYRSPEQAERVPLSLKTDIWSWGLSILDMFNGGVFWVDGAMAPMVLDIYLRRGPPEPALPQMPARLADVLEKCFREDPEDRWADASAIADALRSIYRDLTHHGYARQTPPLDIASPAVLRDRRTFSLGEWRAPDFHLIEILRTSGAHFDEIKRLSAIDLGQLSPPRKVRTYRAAVAADLVAYEEELEFLDQLIAGGNEALQGSVAVLHVDKALIHKALGDIDGALDLYDAALDKCASLIEHKQFGDQAKDNLAIVRKNKAETLAQLNRLADAEDLLRPAIDRLEVAVASRPELRNILAGAHVNLAEVLRRRNDPGQAIAHNDCAIRLREDLLREGQEAVREHLANAYLTKSNALKALDRVDLARVACAQAVTTCEKAKPDRWPDGPDRLAECLFAEADCCRILGRFPDALALIDRAVDLYTDLVFRRGKSQLHGRLANGHQLRGAVLFESRIDPASAETELNTGVQIYEQLVIQEGRRELAHDLCLAYVRLGGFYQTSDRVEAGAAQYDKAIALWNHLPETEKRGDRRGELAMAYLNKAVTIEHRSPPDWSEVKELYDKAVKIWDGLVRDGRRQFRGDLARAMVLRATTWQPLGFPDRVKSDILQWLPVLREEARATGRTDLRKVVAWAENHLRALEE